MIIKSTTFLSIASLFHFVTGKTKLSVPSSVKYIVFGGVVALMVHLLNLEATSHVNPRYQYFLAIGSGAVVAYFVGRMRESWIRRTRQLEEAYSNQQREMEERKQVEQALRQSEERYRDLFDSSADMIQIISPEGKLIYANQSWRENLGISAEEVNGFPMFDIITPEHHPHCMERFEKLLSGGSMDKLETEFITRDGNKILVEGSCNCRYEDGKPVSIRGIFRDVTERKQMEEELQKSQKLESIGILAGGIAHDFNNLLSGVLGVLSLIKSSLPEDDKRVEILQEAHDTCMQGRELTSKFLTFAEGGTPFKKCISIVSLLKKSVEIALTGSHIQCDYSIPDDLWEVNVDAGQLQQVFNNLILNARDAMDEEGELKINAENTPFTAVEGFVLAPGKYIRISITDHGVGIPPENIPKIFDPYFTTKNMASDRGMGFGLSICYSIVKKHDGLITVESQKGMGTSFHIFLPSC